MSERRWKKREDVLLFKRPCFADPWRRLCIKMNCFREEVFCLRAVYWGFVMCYILASSNKKGRMCVWDREVHEEKVRRAMHSQTASRRGDSVLSESVSLCEERMGLSSGPRGHQLLSSSPGAFINPPGRSPFVCVGQQEGARPCSPLCVGALYGEIYLPLLN